MTIEQLGSLAKNKYPDSPEYKGKSDREVGEYLVTKHRAYRGRREVDFTKRREEVIPEKIIPEVKTKEAIIPAGISFAREPEPEPEKTIKEKITEIPKAGISVGTGITKGVASSILGLASLPKKGGEALAGMITSMMGMDKSVLEKAKSIPSIREKVEATGALKAEGKYEKFGKGLEQLAEFFVSPAGKSKGVVQGLNILNKLKKPASVTKVVKEVVPKIVKEGVAFGTIVGVQKGAVDKEVAEAAAIGAVVPIVGPVLHIAKSGILSAINKVKAPLKGPVQEKIWTGIMRRTGDEILANPIAKDVAKLGIVKISKEKILNEMAVLYNKSSKVIERAIKRKEKNVNVKDINVESLEAKIWGRVGTVKTPTKLVESEIKEMRTLFSDIKNVISTYTGGKETISLREAYKLQLSIAREIEKNIGKTDIEKIKITKALMTELNEIVSKLMPRVKNDVHKIAILQQATLAMEKSIASGKAAQADLTEDAALVIAGVVSGTGPLPVIGKHIAFSTAAKTSFSNLMNAYNILPYKEKMPFYLGAKGILAGYVESFIGKD